MNGFTMFDATHCYWLLFIGIFFIFLLYSYRKLTISKKLLVQKIFFFSLLLLELSKQCYLIFTDSYSYWSLPLHLCGMGIFIIGWHTYKPNKVTAEILYALTLPGALAALIFPGWTNEPLFGFIHFNSFFFHILLVGYVLMLLAAKELRPNVKNLQYAVLFLLLTVPPIYFYNHTFGTNFMFINLPLKGSPLELFESWLGNPGYLIGFTGLVMILWVVMYSPFIKNKKR